MKIYTTVLHVYKTNVIYNTTRMDSMSNNIINMMSLPSLADDDLLFNWVS